MAGPRRGVAARRCTLASWAGGARAAGQTCENASRGCRGLSADVSLRLWCESEWRERKADPECKTNLRAQRSFAQVSHRSPTYRPQCPNWP